jgi:DNA-binding LacI/PurR family transcriptional regulator
MKKTKTQFIYDDLRQSILSGKVAPGEQLPTERKMAENYGVAVPTVRQALARLRAEGLIESRRYHGTTVAFPQAASVQVPEPADIKVGLLAFNWKQLSHPVFSRLVDGIEGVLAETGGSLEIIISNDSASAERTFEQSVTQSGVSGWLLPHLLTPSQKAILHKRPEPKLVFHYPDETLGHSFEMDFDSIKEEILGHLQACGYRNVWALAPSGIVSQPRSLLELAKSGGCPEGLTLNLQEVPDSSAETVRAACTRILEADPGADCFVCEDDEQCIGALQALREKGLSCPEIGLVGAGDFPIGSLMQPALTTVSYPYYQIGREAMRLLLDLIGGKLIEPTRRRFLPRLVVRESTAPLEVRTGQAKPLP